MNETNGLQCVYKPISTKKMIFTWHHLMPFHVIFVVLFWLLPPHHLWSSSLLPTLTVTPIIHKLCSARYSAFLHIVNSPIVSVTSQPCSYLSISKCFILLLCNCSKNFNLYFDDLKLVNSQYICTYKFEILVLQKKFNIVFEKIPLVGAARILP